MVCLVYIAASWVQLSVSAGNGWPHNALRHHWLMPISCHFRDCKVLLVTSLTHVIGAITSVQTFIFTFNATMRFVVYIYRLLWYLPRDAMQARSLLSCSVRSLSVRLSVTFVDHVKTNKHIFEIFSPSGSHTILVFPYQTGWRYSDGNPPNGGVECMGGMKKMTIFHQYLALSQKQL